MSAVGFSQFFDGRLADLDHHAQHLSGFTRQGRLTRVNGMVLEASGLHLPVGALCTIHRKGGLGECDAEVVGFYEKGAYLMPLDDQPGLQAGAVVSPRVKSHGLDGGDVPLGPGLLGRVVSSLGRPLDDKGPLDHIEYGALSAPAINPMKRAPIREPLDVGIKAINGITTVGRGQRMGLMAGSGVGKSVLLGMMAKKTTADVIVVGLIGERGREVQEFIQEILGEEGLRRAVVVAAPADTSSLQRVKGANYATRIAEYFRDAGKSVLLIMDSLTRYAMAQREISLSIGEPPATKGYPPSVFSLLPKLVERAGNGVEGGGSITAFYTVLTEGDDLQDPVADNARAVLDGHIVLSRNLADSGHYPAIQIDASVSRVMTACVDDEHQGLAREIKRLFSRYHEQRDLIAVGAYVAGQDPELDRAVQLYPLVRDFLQQKMTEGYGIDDTLGFMRQILDS